MTGATSEIGAEVVCSLVDRGYAVCALGQNSERLAALRVRFGGEHIDTFAADLRDLSEIDATMNEMVRRHGNPEIMVHAAGVWHNGARALRDTGFDTLLDAEVQSVMGVGVIAAMRVSRAVLPAMKAAKKGKIIYVSCGFAGPHEAAGWVHYYVSNKAIDALTQALAAECRPFGVQINAIAPWFVATEPVKKFFPEDAAFALTPSDVAKILTFLLTEEASNISGQILDVRSYLDHG